MSIKRMFAVDLGASGGKCFVGTFEDGAFSMEEIHRFAHEGVTFHLNGEQRDYWNDIEIYRNIVEGLQAYKRNVSDTLDSIGIDTWGADGQFFNASGDMLGKMYCYRDHRLDNMIDIVKSRMDPRRIYDLTGIHFQPFNLSNQMHWFVQNRPEQMKQAAFYLPVPALFYYYLGGTKKVDSSWASITQLMDAREKCWSSEILEALSIPLDIMPEIVEPGAVMGELLAPLAESIGINQAKLIAAPAHDTAAAFAAAPVADTEKALIISSGTWSLVGKLVPEPITSDEAMAANISNEGGVGNIRCLKNCMGTWLIQELRRGWAVEDGKEMSWAEITDIALAAEPFKALVDPDDPGFYNPSNMQQAMDEFCAKTDQEKPGSRGAYLRCVYESLGLKYRLVNEQICAVTGTETDVVNVVGGGSTNPLLSQCTADALGLPVLTGPSEGTAVGNLMVQALGLGIIDSIEDALPIIKTAFTIGEYKPQRQDEWAVAIERFAKLLNS